jgi:hypothetical protein
MSFYLGPLYFEEKDLFLLLALGLLVGGWLKDIKLPFISYPPLIILVFLFLVAKGLLVRSYETLIYLIFLTAFILTNFLTLSAVILYVLFCFIFLKLFNVI